MQTGSTYIPKDVNTDKKYLPRLCKYNQKVLIKQDDVNANRMCVLIKMSKDTHV